MRMERFQHNPNEEKRQSGGNGNALILQHDFGIMHEDTYQVEVEDRIDLSELEGVTERGDVAQRHADGHGAKRGDKQKPRRVALDEGNTLRAQKVHNESLPQDANRKEIKTSWCLLPSLKAHIPLLRFEWRWVA